MFADDAGGFAEDDLDETGIFATAVGVGGGGDVDGALGWGDCGQVDEAVFGFGDYFLGKDEDVVLAEGEFGFFYGGEEDAGQVVAGADFGDVGDGEELDWGFQHAWISLGDVAEGRERITQRRGGAGGTRRGRAGRDRNAKAEDFTTGHAESTEFGEEEEMERGKDRKRKDRKREGQGKI